MLKVNIFCLLFNKARQHLRVLMSSHERSLAPISAHEHTWELTSMVLWRHEHSWVLMSANGAMSMTALELLWMLIAPWRQAPECSGLLMSAHEQSWALMAALDSLWMHLGANGCSWVLTSAHEHSWAWRHGAMRTHQNLGAVTSMVQWGHGH